jgi:hypothetical protein
LHIYAVNVRGKMLMAATQRGGLGW